MKRVRNIYYNLGDNFMPVVYKINVLAELKKKGYSSAVIRKEKIMGEETVQRLRHQKSVSYEVLAKLCKMLDCQPGDILEYVPDNSENGE